MPGSTAPVYILYGDILGIKPLKPGFAEYQVSPQPGFLAWMRGSVLTPLGSIKVDYRVKEDRRTLHLELPAHGEAMIGLPFPVRVAVADGKPLSIEPHSRELRIRPVANMQLDIQMER